MEGKKITIQKIKLVLVEYVYERIGKYIINLTRSVNGKVCFGI